MRIALRRFAILGLVSIVFFALSNLFEQYSKVLMKGYFSVWSIAVRDFSKVDLSNAITLGCCFRVLIVLLGYGFLEMAYFALGDFKKTRNLAHWGMVASRLGLVFTLVILARYILLGFDWQETGPRGDFFTNGFSYFLIVEHISFFISFLFFWWILLRKPFLRIMCLVGVLGWLFSFVLNTSHMFKFSRDIVSAFLGRYISAKAYWGAWYVCDALLALPFVVLLFAGKLTEDAREDEGGLPRDSSKRQVDWSKCMMPLLTLVLIAVPLCVVPFFIRYPYFRESFVYIDYRKNVLIFKSVCVVMGGMMGLPALNALLPFLKHVDFGGMFRFIKGKIGKIRKPVFGAVRASAAPKIEDASIRERLLEIRQLLDEGLITQAEFEQKRTDILSKL